MTTKTTQAPVAEQTIEEKVRERIGTEPLTMYKFAGALSDLLGRHIREQQMYNYRAKKLIKVNPEGRVEAETAVAYVLKRLAKTTAE
jgi:hypothetical protein